MVRAPDCGSGGHGFESLPRYIVNAFQKFYAFGAFFFIIKKYFILNKIKKYEKNININLLHFYKFL